MNITIKDVARQAGVSVATVSRVINNSDYVSDMLRTKVKSTITAMGYYPNHVAISLKKDVSHSIGFLVSDISNAYFIAVARVLEREVLNLRYNIIMCSTEDDEEREKSLIRMLMSKQIDAFVINASGKNDELIAKLSRDVPIVLLHRRIAHEAFRGDLIRSNDFDGGYSLTSHLLSLGHRRIGVVNGNMSVSTGIDRFRGFMKAMEEAGITADEYSPYVYQGDFSTKAGYYGAMSLIGINPPPTAITAMNNEMTVGVLKYLREQRIGVPDDMSVAGFGSIANSDLLYVQPTTVMLNPETIGQKIAELLISRINGMQTTPNREINYISELIHGDTVSQI